MYLLFVWVFFLFFFFGGGGGGGGGKGYICGLKFMLVEILWVETDLCYNKHAIKTNVIRVGIRNNSQLLIT